MQKIGLYKIGPVQLDIFQLVQLNNWTGLLPNKKIDHLQKIGTKNGICPVVHFSFGPVFETGYSPVPNTAYNG